MNRTINATDAARTFSEIINSVKYKGASYTIIRGGKPVAALVPVESVPAPKTLTDLRTIIANLPRLGRDVDDFLHDFEESIRDQPSISENPVWE